MGPDIALAASARDWSDRVHAHLVDHGGGLVRARVMGREQALAERFEILLIDDICSFLTPRLVEDLARLGRQVVGVYSPDDGPDAKRRLLECGVAAVVEAEAPPEEILAVVRQALAVQPVVAKHRHDAVDRGSRIVVGGPPGGVGVTEVAIALSHSLAEVGAAAAVVDIDQAWPSIAQRLSLPLHPNLRSAVDMAHRRASGTATDALMHAKGFSVLGGVANPDGAAPVRLSDLALVLDDLGGDLDWIVIDAGTGLSSFQLEAAESADLVIGVGAGTPVGVTRLIKWARRIIESVDPGRMLVAVNRVARSRFTQGEIGIEIAAALPGVTSVVLPEDAHVGDAAWSGEPAVKGHFATTVRRFARFLVTERVR